MDNKKITIIVAIIVAIVAIIGAAYFLGFFGSESTDFDTKFMSGTFVGEVNKNKIEDNSSFSNWVASYEDKTNNITYNMSCVKGGSFVTDIYELQGLGSPETRKYNSVEWKIYYSQAVPNDNSSNKSNNTVNVYICAADVNGTSYMINTIAYNNTPKCDGSLFCDLFKNNIEPLLNSITLKDGSKAPKMYELLNMTKSDFKLYKDYIAQVKAGNITPTA